MQDDRGKIRNRELAARLRDFSGMRFGNITPTDVDGLIEYHDKGYVIIETKYNAAPMPYGQRLALQRTCDDLQTQKPTLLVVAANRNQEGDIDIANTEVTEYRFDGKWLKRQCTTRQLVERFIAYLDKRQAPQ